MNLVFTINLASSLFLTGLIWMVQCVHYPIFHRLDQTKFTEHIHFHKGSISFLVVPVMSIELVTSAWLAWSAPSDITLHQAGFIAVALIWLVTFFIQVPLHNKLSEARDKEAISRLVSSNWIRTSLWSLKSILSLIILNNTF